MTRYTNCLIAFQSPIVDGNRITYCVSPAGQGKAREAGRVPGEGDLREQFSPPEPEKGVSKDSPCAMIDRMPEPPCGRCGPDETPHFIYLGGA